MYKTQELAHELAQKFHFLSDIWENEVNFWREEFEEGSEFPCLYILGFYGRKIMKDWEAIATAEKISFFNTIEENIATTDSKLLVALMTGLFESIADEISKKSSLLQELSPYLGDKSKRAFSIVNDLTKISIQDSMHFINNE